RRRGEPPVVGDRAGRAGRSIGPAAQQHLPPPHQRAQFRPGGTSPGAPGPPTTAPSSPRVPVSASATIRIAGYPARPSRFLSFPSQHRFRSLSGTLTEFTTRDGSDRIRCCVVLVLSSTSSTSSNGRYPVSSPT